MGRVMDPDRSKVKMKLELLSTEARFVLLKRLSLEVSFSFHIYLPVM